MAVRARAAGEEAPQAEVLRPVEEECTGGLAVAAPAAELLVVRVHRISRLRVEDEADIRLVDAHPDRGGGPADFELGGNDRLLRGDPRAARQATVVGGGAHAARLELGGQL